MQRGSVSSPKRFLQVTTRQPYLHSVQGGGRGGRYPPSKTGVMLDLILAGKKVWEIRGASTKVRGKIALSGGGGRIVGQCHITNSFAIDKGGLGKHVAKHCVKDLGVIPYPRPHAWVLSKARRYKTPFKYSHPRGAIQWVKL